MKDSLDFLQNYCEEVPENTVSEPDVVIHDALNILRTDVICHHGILGMKWGVRRYQNKDGSLTPAGRKKYITEEGKGVHKREKSPGTMPVGGYSSYPQNIIGGGIVSSGDMTEKELAALHNKTVDDIRNSENYKEIFKIAEELKRMLDESRESIKGVTAATVFEAKTDKMIKRINELLKGIDTKFAKETSIIKNFKKDFSPRDWVLSDLSEKTSLYSAIKVDRVDGKIVKGWKRPSVALQKNKTKSK